ncbi:MAG: hypothetical protein JW768_01140 [Chitinispirillaceae bacterium]|nr:hypothetical protein [Chitinispirillaceae bacterium]
MNTTTSSAKPQKLLEFSRREWLAMFVKGEHEKLCQEFVRCLDHFTKTYYRNLTADVRALINDFVESFLYFFCHPDFNLPRNFVQSMLGFHATIANLAAISDFGTTTPWVVRLARKKENYYKLLTLYNVRCRIDINPSLFFEINEFFGSEWWTFYWLSAPAFCIRSTHERIRSHLNALDHRFMVFGANARASYFPVTYVAPESEQTIKKRLNRLVSTAFSNVKIANAPNPSKIALISDRWYRSAVYTSLSPLIRSLKGHYDITLVNFGGDEEIIMDREMFSRIITIQMKGHEMDLNALQNNEWSAVIYPDIGMNPESIYLANIRIAPVQIMMYGHPTSTWGSKIDYFIGGRKVEDLAEAQENYGERLVVIPGMGVYPVYPDDFTAPADPPQEDPLLINCGWTAQKVSYPLLEALQEILIQADKHVVFQIFPGGGVSHYNGFIPFVKDIHSMLGADHVRVASNMPRLAYLAELCKGAFSLDSYPFGGFNSIIDPLYLKKPVIAWETGRAYSRFASATLEIIGMQELIARNRDEYIEKTVRLINDDGYRKAMTGKVAAVDLKAAFAQHENPAYFRKAIASLIENHQQLSAEGSRKPIIIE